MYLRSFSRHAVLLLTLAATATQVHAQTGAPKLPKFADYPVAVYQGPKAEPILDDEFSRDNGSIYKAENEKMINAAGEYVRVYVTCGSSCVSPDLLSQKTGKRADIPFTVSGWREVAEDFAPMRTRADSRLVVFQGALNEKGIVGRHYYVIEDGKLRHLQTVNTNGNFARTPRL
jgi:hypothetical protein